MPQIVIPRSPGSPTAAQGLSDMSDQNIYSSIVCQHAGSGSVTFFNVPRGQTIPALNGVTRSTQAHHLTYNELTTNVTKAGEFGGGLGDGIIRNIWAHAEQAAWTTATGAARAFGATSFELLDITSKLSFELRIGGKRQIIGPLFTFPDMGGVEGSIAASATTSTTSTSLSKLGGKPRMLKIALPVGRTDAMEGEVRVATGAALAFSTTSGEGQPFLLWFVLHAYVKGDVR